jgi:16S rRNA (cytosine967-C5)-methyltransferase
LSLEFIQKVKAEQAEILEEYAKIVKVGGKLVYATCSILPSENQLQVDAFLAKHANYELEDARVVLPSESGFDGFFMARLKRKA